MAITALVEAILVLVEAISVLVEVTMVLVLVEVVVAGSVVTELGIRRSRTVGIRRP